MPLDNNDLIAQIAAQKLGPAAAPAAASPGAAPAAGGDPAAAATAVGAQSGQPPAQPKASDAPTDMEKAQAKLAPVAADGASAENSVSFLKVGDQEYTEDQLKGTLGRYKDLNYRWQTEVAPHKQSLAIINNIIAAAEKSGQKVTGDDVAKLIDASVRAFIKSPQMGNGAPSGQDQGGGKGSDNGAGMAGADGEGLDDAALTQWEKENAVKLPPGFRDMAKTNKQLSGQIGQLTQMMQQLVAGNQQGQQQQQQQQQSQQMQVDAATKMIATNLAGSFAKAGLPDDDQAKADFRMFAAQRGYDLSDFLDPELTAKVVNDYKANKDAPEIQRLRAIAQKRQAFTGNVEGAPGSSGAAGGAAAAGGDPMFNSMVGTAMAARGLGG